MDIEYASSAKEAVINEEVTKAKIGKSHQKKQLVAGILLNKSYCADISVISKVFPNNKVGYKPRTVYFQIAGDLEHFQLQLLNPFNFYYF